ncbi:DUF4097 family beta strand repeat-containing protein [Negadavirga shengliensis]|uniref:DUF4097 family beta strand repeat-containing protein n=1 Tax=Negadavirga shengliensis TaxID=1389218 RepID=A0ABV9T8P4_9BACT
METISDIEMAFEGIEEIEVIGEALEISYRGGPEAKEVFLNGLLESNDASTEGISYHRSGNKLRVEAKTGGMGSFLWGKRTAGFINLTGPEDIYLQMKSSSGSMDVSHVRHQKILLKASSGRIYASDIHSDDLQIQISSGRAEAEDLEGTVHLQLSSGRAGLKKTVGDVQFKGSSGFVEIIDVAGLVSGTMSSGKATLGNIAELGEIRLSSGMLEANNCGLGSKTYLQASSGFLKVTTHSSLEDFNFDFSVGSGSLTIGDRHSSNDLLIDNGAVVTVKGSVRSGKMDISEY